MGKRSAQASTPKSGKKSLGARKREREELEAATSGLPSQGGTRAAQGATSSGQEPERYVPV